MMVRFPMYILLMFMTLMHLYTFREPGCLNCALMTRIRSLFSSLPRTSAVCKNIFKFLFVQQQNSFPLCLSPFWMYFGPDISEWCSHAASSLHDWALTRMWETQCCLRTWRSQVSNLFVHRDFFRFFKYFDDIKNDKKLEVQSSLC